MLLQCLGKIRELLQIWQFPDRFKYSIICIFYMNYLIFDPKSDLVSEWEDLYYSKKTLSETIDLIKETNMFIHFIQRQEGFDHLSQIARKPSLADQADSNPPQEADAEGLPQPRKELRPNHLNLELDAILKARKSKGLNLMTDLLKIRSSINLKTEVEEARRMGTEKQLNPPIEKCDSENLLSDNRDLRAYHRKLSNVKQLAMQNLKTNLQKETDIIVAFTYIKLRELENKLSRFNQIFHQLPKHANIFTLYANIFIEAFYLAKFLNFNRGLLDEFTKESPNFAGYNLSYNEADTAKIVKASMKQIDQVIEDTRIMQNNVRQIYFRSIKLKRNRIRDSCQLQREIVDDIAVNRQQFTQISPTSTFIGGLAFGFLFFALILTLVVRFVTNNFEENANYLQNFRVWRGASYMLCFNWILAFVLYLCETFKLNYKLILLHGDCFIPKSHAFFFTSVVMTAIYLILFGVFMINELKVVDSPGLRKLGYYQWIFNIAFILNPFKILNYQARRYFLQMIFKVLASPFLEFTFSAFFVSLIIGSWTQPFSDFSYTVCKAIYQQERTCDNESRLATFIFTMTFSFYRIILAGKCHKDMKTEKIFTRPMLALIANICILNNTTASYVYSTFLNTGTLVYWIISAIIATIVGLNGDFRSDWGLISFDPENCFLRKNLRFSNLFYYIVMIVNAILTFGWIFTISDSTNAGLGINMIYFLMILSYVELARKGLWIFLRMQELHVIYKTNFKAIESDYHLYEEMKHQIQQKHKIHDGINHSQQIVKKSNHIIELDNREDVQQLKRSVIKKLNKKSQNKKILIKIKKTLSQIHQTHDNFEQK